MIHISTKRRLPWLWIVVGAVAALTVGVPLAIAYFGVRARIRDRALLRDEIERIANEPLTTSEMDAYAAVVPADPRARQAWLDALAAFETEAYKKAQDSAPRIYDDSLPPLDLPLSPEQSAQFAQYLDATRSMRDAIYAAAALPGNVRFPRDYRRGIATFREELHSLRTAGRSLELEFQVLARDVELEPALRNLQTRMATARIARYETNTDGFLVHVAVASSALRSIRALANARALDEEQLDALQVLIAPIGIHAHVEQVLLGERAMAFHAFQSQGRPGFSDFEDQPFETSRDLSRILRPGDCAKTLQIMRELRSAAALPLPQAIDATRQVETLTSQEESRYPLTSLLVPTLDALVETDARTTAEVRLTQTVLAVHRYRLKNGDSPTALADLVPAFLPVLPQDPYNGHELRFVAQNDGILLYSVGRDRRDDSGVTSNRLEPDIAVKVTIPPAEE